MVVNFRYYLLPHHTNNHRAKALHIDALFVYILAFSFFWAVSQWVHRTNPNILGFATDIRVEQLLNSVNGKRQEAGLPPLTLNGELSQAAKAKAGDMFAKNYWAHNSPDGKTPWDFIARAGYRYTVAGENLAKNFSDSQAVVDAWMASPTHRDNVLKPGYRDIGFAVVNGMLDGEETTLVVQMFGAGSGSSPVSSIAKSTVTEEPVVISGEDRETTLPVSQSDVLMKNTSVTFKPLLDMPTTSRMVSYSFIVFLIVILGVDAWIVSKRRIVRVAGHNIAHLLFFMAILLATGAIVPGKIL